MDFGTLVATVVAATVFGVVCTGNLWAGVVTNVMFWSVYVLLMVTA